MSEWQSYEQRCGVVLSEVFLWLPPRDLAVAGAACRAWRHAANEPTLWRRLLLQDGATPQGLRALELETAAVSWRQEYVTACAGWRLESRLPVSRVDDPRSRWTVSMAPHGCAIALACNNSLAVLEYGGGEWCERWRQQVKPLGLELVTRVAWSDAANRLLVTGCDPRQFTVFFVFRVYDEAEEPAGSVVTSVSHDSSTDLEGCWADPGGAALVTLEVRHSFPISRPSSWTHVSLHKESQSWEAEPLPLLRIFESERIPKTGRRVLVVDTPDDPRPDVTPATQDAEYLRSISTHHPPGSVQRVLVHRSGKGLRAWLLGELQPPARGPNAYDEYEAVRAACTPHSHSLSFPRSIRDLQQHPGGRCMWVGTSGGGATRLRELCALGCAPRLRLELGLSRTHVFVSGVCDDKKQRGTGVVTVFSARSGAGVCALPAAGLCAALPGAGRLLARVGGELLVYRSRATPQLTPNDCT